MYERNPHPAPPPTTPHQIYEKLFHLNSKVQEESCNLSAVGILL
jgi:hypothetical protein